MNKYFYYIPQKLASIIAVVAFMLFTSACATKLNFTKSNIVPAAEGKVKIKKDRNNNYAIAISIVNLAEVERLQPSKKTYVAWIETNGYGIKNIGRLQSSTGFLSRSLKASLNTTTSFKPKRVFITAEMEGSIQYPAGQEILTTH
jgi:hypothetical protein